MRAPFVPTSSWVDGFIGERPYTDPGGDYLRTTFCYYKTPLKQNKRAEGNESALAPRDQGDNGNVWNGAWAAATASNLMKSSRETSYWRYGYLNTHYNATYFMHHYCMEDAPPPDRHGCGYEQPRTPASRSFLYHDPSSTHSPIPNPDKRSRITYLQQTGFTWLMFGRGDWHSVRTRRLDVSRGVMEMPAGSAEDMCGHYCEAGLLRPRDSNTRSHSELDDDVDGMCDGCM